MNSELNNESQQFLQVSFKNRMYVAPMLDMTVDMNWFAPGNNLGGDVGLDVMLSGGRIKPFVGFGVGAHYFGKGSEAFGAGVGTSAVARAGLLVALSNSFTMTLSVPYYFIANQTRDQLVGINIGFLFSDGFQNIRKLNFN